MFICYAFLDPSPAPDHSTSERSGSCLGNRDGEEGSQGPAVVVHGESLCCFECFVRVIYLGVTLGVKHGKTIHWNVSRSSRLGCASAKDANDLNVISGSPTRQLLCLDPQQQYIKQRQATRGFWGLFPRRLWNAVALLTKFDSQTEECQRFWNRSKMFAANQTFACDGSRISFDMFESMRSAEVWIDQNNKLQPLKT